MEHRSPHLAKIPAPVGQADHGRGLVLKCSGADTPECHTRLEGGKRVLQESCHQFQSCEGHIKPCDMKVPITINNPAETESVHSEEWCGAQLRLARRINVICLYFGRILKPFFLVLHFKIKLFSMYFSIAIDYLSKHKVGNSKKTKK